MPLFRKKQLFSNANGLRSRYPSQKPYLGLLNCPITALKSVSFAKGAFFRK